MINVTIYTRRECRLCDQALQDLASLQAQIPHTVIVIDIDSDPQAFKQYLSEIPVIKVGAYELKAPFTKQDLQMTLGAVRDASEFTVNTRVSTTKLKINTSDRFSLWLADHWLFVLNLLFIFYLGLPVLAPVLMRVGAQLPARIIYTAYSPLCHQLGFRSFFLFGEQPYYPRAAANIPGILTFGQATGIDENDLLSARAFTGNGTLGYKIAICERDVAIYGAIILFGLLYGLTDKRIPPLNWAAWIIIAIIPIGLDGFSQLFSQLPFAFIGSILPYRESTPFLRVFTGFLFGFFTAWFGLPYAEESMRETRLLVDKKNSVNVKKQ